MTKNQKEMIERIKNTSFDGPLFWTSTAIRNNKDKGTLVSLINAGLVELVGEDMLRLTSKVESA